MLFLNTSGAFAYEEDSIHGFFEEAFKDVEAVFRAHVEDRKSLSEITQEAWQGLWS